MNKLKVNNVKLLQWMAFPSLEILPNVHINILPELDMAAWPSSNSENKKNNKATVVG